MGIIYICSYYASFKNYEASIIEINRTYLEGATVIDAQIVNQPLSGEYEDRIYDISSHWNSQKWNWIKFTNVCIVILTNRIYN